MKKNMSDKMYREYIIDLYKNPLNYGNLKNATHTQKLDNTLCGDEIKIFLNVEKEKIKDVKFSGIGCAISMASASLFTEKIKKMNVKDVQKMNKQDILEILGISVNPSRIKCVLLPLDATKKALSKK